MKDIDLVELKEAIATRKGMPDFGPDTSIERIRIISATKDSFTPDVVEALINQLEAVQRERDEAIKQKNESGERFQKAVQYGEKLETELARRDAAAGEPVAWEVWRNDEPKAISNRRLAERYASEGLRVWPLVYTTAQPAVLPPAELSLDNGVVGYSEGWNACREAAKALGCQPEKVVKLPPPEKDGGTDWQGDITAGCVNRMRDKCIAALDAAGVKWEVTGEKSD